MKTGSSLSIAMTAAAALLLGACAQSLRPPPTSVYRTDAGDTFARIPEALRSPVVDVLYVTDRKPETDGYGRSSYGPARSQSLAYGSAMVELGGGKSWEELVAWTERDPSASGVSLQERLVSVEELGRFPATPYLFDVDRDGQVAPDAQTAAEIARAHEAATAELRGRLEIGARRDVTVLVHGIQTSFEDWVKDAARGSHLMGHFSVTVAYTWPAGGPGLLSGYAYDRESGEFTILHLKQMLRAFASMPEIERIHVMAHSRGTDVVTTALRELIIEARAAGEDPRVALKLENLVLVAADLDLQVVEQRFSGEALGPAFRRVTVYTSANDDAIAAAQGLFNSRERLGSVTPEALRPSQKEMLRRAANIDVIVYEGSRAGSFGHGYFRNPAVVADAILLLRDGRNPGAENGRPLEPLGDHFWRITDGYLREE